MGISFSGVSRGCLVIDNEFARNGFASIENVGGSDARFEKNRFRMLDVRPCAPFSFTNRMTMHRNHVIGNICEDATAGRDLQFINMSAAAFAGNVWRLAPGQKVEFGNQSKLHVIRDRFEFRSAILILFTGEISEAEVSDSTFVFGDTAIANSALSTYKGMGKGGADVTLTRCTLLSRGALPRWVATGVDLGFRLRGCRILEDRASVAR